jgi:hypothetical protein
MTFVYAHVAVDGSYLYVGQTSHPDKRTKEHRRGAAWWPLVDRVDIVDDLPYPKARARERELIEQHEPPFNFQYSRAWREQMEAVDDALRVAPPLTPEQVARVRQAFQPDVAAPDAAA